MRSILFSMSPLTSIKNTWNVYNCLCHIIPFLSPIYVVWLQTTTLLHLNTHKMYNPEAGGCCSCQHPSYKVRGTDLFSNVYCHSSHRTPDFLWLKPGRRRVIMSCSARTYNYCVMLLYQQLAITFQMNRVNPCKNIFICIWGKYMVYVCSNASDGLRQSAAPSCFATIMWEQAVSVLYIAAV